MNCFIYKTPANTLKTRQTKSITYNINPQEREKQYIPAEIWRFSAHSVSKVFFFDKELKEVNLDPNLETADTDRSDNYWPQRMEKSKFQVFKEEKGKKLNSMQKSKK